MPVEGQPNVRLVPGRVLGANCFAYDPNRSAACLKTQQSSTPLAAQIPPTPSGNWSGGYPPVFYRVMSVFITDDVASSVMLMRLANCLLAVGAVLALCLSVPRHLRAAATLPLLLAAIPLTVFFVPSTNPSSWAVISAATLWLAFYASFESYGVASELTPRVHRPDDTGGCRRAERQRPLLRHGDRSGAHHAFQGAATAQGSGRRRPALCRRRPSALSQHRTFLRCAQGFGTPAPGGAAAPGWFGLKWCTTCKPCPASCSAESGSASWRARVGSTRPSRPWSVSFQLRCGQRSCSPRCAPTPGLRHPGCCSSVLRWWSIPLTRLHVPV